MDLAKNLSASTGAGEEIFTDLFHKGEALVKPQWKEIEDRVRESPGKAVLIAAGVGYMLHRLPLGSLFSSALKLAWAFGPPAAVAAIASKGLSALNSKAEDEPAASAKARRGKALVTM